MRYIGRHTRKKDSKLLKKTRRAEMTMLKRKIKKNKESLTKYEESAKKIRHLTDIEKIKIIMGKN